MLLRKHIPFSNFVTQMKKAALHIILFIAICIVSMSVSANPLPAKRHTQIVLKYSRQGDSDAYPSRSYHIHIRDPYYKKVEKINSEHVYGNVAALDFDLYHPMYDEIVDGNRRIPFYVEPGDTLMIVISANGTALSYRQKNGKPVKYENLLRHDISNNEFYNADIFAIDKENAFPLFVETVSQRMNDALDKVNDVADKWNFSFEERSLALDNVRLQFGLWIFEYAPSLSSEIANYSRLHEEGWQAMPQQDTAIETLTDTRNYRFMQQMPFNDSLCIASKYYSPFILSYQNALVLNHDQHLYLGETETDMARMDSAYVAKDLAMTDADAPSLFVRAALEIKHIELPPAPVNDGSIALKEVQVIGLDHFYSRFGKAEEPDYKKITKELWNPSTYDKGVNIDRLFNMKKIRRYKHAKKVIDKMGADDTMRELIDKAYESETGEKVRR